jgi:chromosome segregation ATPase
MKNFRSASAILVLVGALPMLGHAADGDSTARLREMLRRTQEALRQAQSDNAELARAKADSDSKLQAAGTQVKAAQSGSTAAQQAVRTRLQSAQEAQADLDRKLADANQRLAAANAKQSDTAKQLAGREAELAQAHQLLEQSRSATTSCEAKNLALYGYAQSALQLYRNKGVWASLAQKDPVLGLKQVGVDNVVQEYQQKFASQTVKPAVP